MEEITKKASLPPEAQEKALNYIERVQRETEEELKAAKPFRGVLGIFADRNSMSPRTTSQTCAARPAVTFPKS